MKQSIYNKTNRQVQMSKKSRTKMFGKTAGKICTTKMFNKKSDKKNSSDRIVRQKTPKKCLTKVSEIMSDKNFKNLYAVHEARRSLASF